MRLRRLLVLPVSVAVLAFLGFAGWLFSLPHAERAPPPAAISLEERDVTLEALRPPKRERPVVAIIGLNESTETTDYLMPYGILKRADVAQVLLVSARGGAVRLYPALSVESELSMAEFDRRYPEGADYVVVPAMEPNDAPEILEWMRAQSAGGARIIGVCAGATVVANAGLLDDRRATTHWFYLGGLLKRHPEVMPVAGRRYVVDGNVATTTGISASLPMSLTLVEAIGGRARAEEVAQSLGVAHWDARHRSADFGLTRAFASTVMGNVVAFWNKEGLPLHLTPGMDEVVLAMQADAWSRTYRSSVQTVSSGKETVRSLNGVRIHPDRIEAEYAGQSPLPALEGRVVLEALDENLAAIAARYGQSTAEVVAMQLEYRWP